LSTVSANQQPGLARVFSALSLFLYVPRANAPGFPDFSPSALKIEKLLLAPWAIAEPVGVSPTKNRWGKLVRRLEDRDVERI